MKRTLAVAESCTGGLLAKLITDQPGSSEYFVEGVVTYSNRSKIKRLGVSSQTLKKRGAVSPEVAKEMVLGIKRTSGSDYALSITGIAGPTGATPSKPVGLVYVGVATPRHVAVHKYLFSGDRLAIRHRSALAALDLLRKELR